MSIQKLTLLLWPALMLALASCKKDENAGPDVLPSENFARTFIFDTTSYWVYQDENSGALDSVWTTQSNVRYGYVYDQNYSNAPKQKQFTCTMVLRSSLRGEGLQGMQIENANPNVQNAPIPPYIVRMGIMAGYNVSAFDPWYRDSAGKLWQGYGDAIKLIDSSTIVESGSGPLGKGYRFETDSTATTGTVNSVWSTTWVKNIGLTFYKTTNGERWGLVRWKAKPKWPVR